MRPAKGEIHLTNLVLMLIVALKTFLSDGLDELHCCRSPLSASLRSCNMRLSAADFSLLMYWI